ncbi:succinate-semialdehyde dehydrogenase NADP+ [Lapidilactobacillus dextrinicus DSM 20335]|uniref:Succinate-semialdehyde dehydrogenase NADP n=1 Tax=Lapidilactobacillus dextrinicus DSM 20335 TaxID=1423738 RepID=A0A0R2BGK1_9LACO|nr:NAD-dependent succinate-semialdehyde dehydrogenase [Lapidilactobacillus dextrinicus]KRM78401.1 succinate-semialdehyde dehydrogenase NADP+ [Lapidilactobacillus dextrinicus DSM 20335]QFG46552.1 NAD-dependent succinate-semialdehyde dehydrogenase [Lapidilactobacillus dextrinicus]
MPRQTVNPYTNEVLKTFSDATDEEIQIKLQVADDLYHTMKHQPVEQRAEALHKVATYMRDHRHDLAKIMILEMGKLIAEAEGEVELCAMIADYFADHGAEMMKPTLLDTRANGEAKVYKQATGVILAVEPWNFPYYQIMRVFAPNFIVGNPMILRDAANIPWSAQTFADMVIEAGAPEGSITNLFMSYDQVGEMIADPRIQGVALTGSERGGSAVAKEAGQNLKKSTMELGGQDVFIVLADANMNDVNQIAWRARLYNAGQVCTSSKRFIVMDSVYDEFLQNLIENFAAVKPGDPMDQATTLAPMNTKKAKEKLQKQVDEAIAAGATVAYGNEAIDMPGQFFMPTILTDISADNPARHTEMFGPVAQVYRVHSEQEAIELANDSQYGLGGIIFSGDPVHGEAVATQIETGMVFVNNFMASLPELPFGGVKNSGYGRELSELGLLAFVNEKLVVTADHPDLDNLAGGLVIS